jgi:[ribosomal protein S5]-alanine N-acetyltransferase
METRLRLETARLELVPFSGELIDALGDRLSAARVIGADVPEGWPDDQLLELLNVYAPWIAEDPARLGFGPWFVIAREEGSVVGSAGFLGTPNADMAIELGFGIQPRFRNRGYAAEAARRLVEWGLAQPSVEKIVARCDPNNAASIRVLEKVGMTRVGHVDELLLWEARRAEAGW